MFSIFNEEVQKVLLNAKKEMLLLKSKYVGSEHMFLSMLSSTNSFSDFLKKYNITYDKYKKKLLELVGLGKEENNMFLYTPLLKKIIEEAMLLSRERGSEEVEICDMVMASFEEEDGIGIKVLNLLGINDEVIDEYYYNNIKKKKEDKKLLIEDFGIDLTLKASTNEIDPVIGRDKEIKRMIEILCRKYKNNPLLVGPAGVGKTAIIEELARLITLKKVPNKLIGKRIISVSLSSLVANTKYRGEFEERITKMLKEIEENPDIILFIDEVHTIMGAGGAEGAIDAANIFKPALSRGNIKLIGATTLDEFKQSIEKDKAMERRFQKIDVEEATKEETIEILKGLRNVYEKFHGVKISDQMIDRIVSLSNRYIHNRYEPDKSIDVLDDVCAKASLTINKNNQKIRKYYDELSRIRDNKNSYLKVNDFDNAYLIRNKEKEICRRIGRLERKEKNNYNEVMLEDIYEVISMKTGVPVSRLNNSDKNIELLAKNLKKEIIGQDDVIDEIISSTKKSKYNLGRKPLSFLFIGPSGSGKTELAELYGKYLFNNKIVRFDGSEYKEKESINKILGSFSGYVGYDDNKNKLEEIRNNPYSLVLFDEIEKASSDVTDLFLQILDDGKITDNRGNVVYFDNCVIILTTSIFTQNDMGFVEKDVNNNKKVDTSISKDILNRIKNVVYFNKLNYSDIYSILKKEIKSVKNEFKDKNIDIKINSSNIKELVDKTNYLEKGARDIKKTVLDYIDTYITNKKLYS